MAHDAISIFTDGYYQRDSEVPNASEILSAGYFYYITHTPTTGKMAALMTEGYFVGAGLDQTAEEMFTAGQYLGIVPPVGGAEAIAAIRQYIETHY